jgi:hypothetical protein
MCRVLITIRGNIKISAQENKSYKDPKEHKTTFHKEYSKSSIKERDINWDACRLGAKLINIS